MQIYIKISKQVKIHFFVSQNVPKAQYPINPAQAR